jgi:hypothetical protein
MKLEKTRTGSSIAETKQLYQFFDKTAWGYLDLVFKYFSEALKC